MTLDTKLKESEVKKRICAIFKQRFGFIPDVSSLLEEQLNPDELEEYYNLVEQEYFPREQLIPNKAKNVEALVSFIAQYGRSPQELQEYFNRQAEISYQDTF